MNAYPERPSQGDPAIWCEELQARYHRRQDPVLSGLSVAIPRGRVTALIGPNGCGKSTLLKSLARQLRFVEGQILLDGRSIATAPPREVAKRLGILFQENTAPDGLTVEGLVQLGRHPHLGWLQPPGEADREAVERALRAAGIRGLRGRRLEHLSGGQRQLAWIAMALAQDTGVLLLDEPTTFLDMSHQIQVMEVVTALKDRGITVVMVVHDVNLAVRHADHLVLLREGVILVQGSPAEVVTPEWMRVAYGVEGRLVSDEPGGGFLFVATARSDGP